MSRLGGLFKKRGAPAETPATPQDMLVGIERETTRLRAERDRLAVQITKIGDALARLDDARRPLAFQAKVDGNADAGRALADANTERRRLDDERRDSVDALAQLDARLDALSRERREAERARDVACVSLLVAEQATLAATLDADFVTLAERVRHWVELDILIVDHAQRIGVSPGRGVLARLQDILSHHVYAVLPAQAQARAVDLRIGLTESKRRATFAAMSAVHGPTQALLGRPSDGTKEHNPCA